MTLSRRRVPNYRKGIVSHANPIKTEILEVGVIHMPLLAKCEYCSAGVTTFTADEKFGVKYCDMCLGTCRVPVPMSEFFDG